MCALQFIQVAFDKITLRIRRLCEQEPPLSAEVDPTLVCQKVVQGVYSGVKTTELDSLAAETAAYMSTTHPGMFVISLKLCIFDLLLIFFFSRPLHLQATVTWQHDWPSLIFTKRRQTFFQMLWKLNMRTCWSMIPHSFILQVTSHL